MGPDILETALRFDSEIFLALLLYMLCLKKQSNFVFRSIAGAACYTAVLLGFLFAGFDMDWLWFVIAFAGMIPICRFCCTVSWIDAIYCAALSYATQHLASSIFILIIYRGTAPIWNGTIYYLVFTVVYAVAYKVFARPFRKTGNTV